jgi:catechol 2,3-dioxygenase-like lactoylglutathione lyase family enzyme
MSSSPVFDQFNIVVSDMDASVAFYRRLGLTIADTDPDWDRHHRTATQPDGIDLDLDSIEFARQWNRGWPEAAGGRTGVLGFRVDARETVDATYEDLVSAGYTGQQPPYDAFWGARYAIVEDPDGNAIGLMSPIDPARRSTPAAPPG